MVKKGVFIELISIVWTVLEAVVAILAGVAANSLALFAFGVDSIIELVAGFVLLWRLRLELQHKSIKIIERAERVASWVVGVALILLAVYILVSALYNFYYHNTAEASAGGIALAVAAGILMPLIAGLKKKIGTAIKSDALIADGACSMVCAYMSWVLIIGVIATAVFHIWWIDSVISVVFVYFVAVEGLEALEVARGRDGACKHHS